VKNGQSHLRLPVGGEKKTRRPTDLQPKFNRQEPSDAPELTFYVYRASSEEVDPWDNGCATAVGIEVGGGQKHPIEH